MRRSVLLTVLVLTLLSLTAASAGSITGSVTIQASGAPVPGAAVVAVKIPFDSTIVATMTDSSGHYTIGGLPVGHYVVTCRIRGGMMTPVDTAFVNIEQENQVVSGVNFQIQLAPRIDNLVAGRVVDAESRTGIHGAAVNLTGAHGQMHSVISDSNGHYRFTNIEPGVYRLSAGAPGYREMALPRDIYVGNDTRITEILIPLQPIMQYHTLLRGFVYDSVSGEPIAGAMVFDNIHTLRYDSLEQHWAFTDDHGYYEFRNLPPADYRLTCRAEGYLPRDIAGVQIVASETTSVDFRLVALPAGTMTGTVTLATGEPLAGAKIEFMPLTMGPVAFLRGAISDSNGNYSAKLPPGLYVVACHAWLGGYPAVQWYGGETRTPVPVVIDSTTAGINFVFTPPRTITIAVSGQVTDQGGSPLADALVVPDFHEVFACRDSLADPRGVKTDAGGNYSLAMTVTARDAFRFNLSARHPGFRIEFYDGKEFPWEADRFEVVNDTVITGINFSLDTLIHFTNAIRGTVTDNALSPIAGAMVFAHGRLTRNIRVAVTDSLGSYSLENLLAEKYIINFSAPGYISEMYDDARTLEEATPVEARGIVTGIDAVLDLAVEDSLGGIVNGTVRDDHDSSIAGAVVMLYKRPGGMVRSTVTADDGSFTMENVPAGEYTAVASKPGYQSASVAVAINPSDVGATTVNLVLTYRAPFSEMAFGGGWNLISLPMRVGNGRADAVIPGFNGNLYRYGDNGYNSSMEIRNGLGYWIRQNTEMGFIVEGSAVLAETIQVHAGWNLIGALSVPLPVNAIVSPTEGLVLSRFFGYHGGYHAVDELAPGAGYWVKANVAGTLILSAIPNGSVAPVSVVQTADVPPPAPGDEIVQNVTSVPASFALHQNYPNPFNPSTAIAFDLPADAHVTVKIFNLIGVEVATLVDGPKEAGSHTVTWDASGFPSGMYFCKIAAGADHAVRKLMYIR